MTRCFKFRLVPSLFLILAFIACVHAHPSGFDPSGALDWEQFLDVANVVANNEIANMTTSPMFTDALDDLLQPPLTQAPNRSILHSAPPTNHAFTNDMNFTSASRPRNTNLSIPTTASYDPAAAFQQEQTRLLSNTENYPNGGSIQQWVPSGGNNTQAAPVIVGTGSQFPPTPIGAQLYGHTSQGFEDHFYRDPSQLVPSHPPTQAAALQNTPPYAPFPFPRYDSPQVQASLALQYPVDSKFDLGPSQSLPQFMAMASSDVTDNYNYQPGISPSTNNAVGGMKGWLLRAPTIGDRVMPRVDTTHLAPPQHASANRSASSASTTGSSSRFSARRNRWQMLVGPHLFTCDICQSGFDSQGELTHHRRCHQPYQQRRHVCPACGKRFQYRKDLTRHAPQHNPDAPRFHCPHAGCKYQTNRGFGRLDHLERHLNSQHGQRADTPQQE